MSAPCRPGHLRGRLRRRPDGRHGVDRPPRCRCPAAPSDDAVASPWSACCRPTAGGERCASCWSPERRCPRAGHRRGGPDRLRSHHLRPLRVRPGDGAAPSRPISSRTAPLRTRSRCGSVELRGRCAGGDGAQFIERSLPLMPGDLSRVPEDLARHLHGRRRGGSGSRTASRRRLRRLRHLQDRAGLAGQAMPATGSARTLVSAHPRRTRRSGATCSTSTWFAPCGARPAAGRPDRWLLAEWRDYRIGPSATGCGCGCSIRPPRWRRAATCAKDSWCSTSRAAGCCSRCARAAAAAAQRARARDGARPADAGRRLPRRLPFQRPAQRQRLRELAAGACGAPTRCSGPSASPGAATTSEKETARPTRSQLGGRALSCRYRQRCQLERQQRGGPS